MCDLGSEESEWKVFSMIVVAIIVACATGALVHAATNSEDISTGVGLLAGLGSLLIVPKFYKPR